MFKTNQGSVLVFSLIVLSLLLSAAISVAIASILNQQSVSSTGKSVQSFQVANSGIELTLQKIYKGNYTTLEAMASAMGAVSCIGGVITKKNYVGGDVRISFFDNDGSLVNCTATNWRDSVVRIKSEGSAFGTTRVVETAIAATGSIKILTGNETTGFLWVEPLHLWCKNIDLSSASFTSVPKIMTSIIDTAVMNVDGYTADRIKTNFDNVTSTSFRLCGGTSSNSSSDYDNYPSIRWMAIE